MAGAVCTNDAPKESGCSLETSSQRRFGPPLATLAAFCGLCMLSQSGRLSGEKCCVGFVMYSSYCVLSLVVLGAVALNTYSHDVYLCCSTHTHMVGVRVSGLGLS